MDSKPRGILLIINNMKFDKHDDLSGYIKDKDKLSDLFTAYLGWEEIVKENLTAKVTSRYNYVLIQQW